MRHLILKSFAVLTATVLLGIAIVASPNGAPAPAQLSPGPNDGRIAYVTARLLDNYNYSQQPFDAEMSGKFLDGYLEMLDPRRENFLQSDIDGFAHYRTNLNTLTIRSNGTADLTPAFEIYQCFLGRLRQHNAYVEELLKQDKFKFTGDDHILVDRRHAPYPKDLAEAKDLWREQLRYQYLQEKLSRELSGTNNDVLLPLSKTNLAEIDDTLARHYRWNFHMATNWDSTDVLQAYLEALAHAYDPHSDYFNTQHAQDFSINMSLSLFGIGAQLTEDDGYCTISALIRGGPAAKSDKLNEKDRIVAVAQGNQPFVDVVDMELDRVVQLIRGTKGTQVRLTISPADDPTARRIVTLTRDEIKLEDQEAQAKLVEMPDGHGGTNRIGIIDLPSFYATIPLPGNDHSTPKFASDDVARLIKKLKQENVAGIVLDLRNNPGGSLEEAIKLTGLFIKSGPVVQARDPSGEITVDADPDPSVLYDGPLAVVVNRFSASAAEIAAAALQDYGRAIIVGDTSTHGKGTVQNLNPLRPFWPENNNLTNDPGTVKITIRKFYRISGASTQLKGVVPDIILPDILNYSDDIGETALENPLPWDTIPGAKYENLNRVEPYLNELRQESDARLATNQDFAYIRQDIGRFKKIQADKTVSLNEREEIKEREDNQARQKARDKERDARKPSDMKIYEITVENAGKSGLPEPMSMTTTNTIDVGVNNDSSGNIVINTAMANIKKPTVIEKPAVKNVVPLDPMLDETINILEDYIFLLPGSHVLIAK